MRLDLLTFRQVKEMFATEHTENTEANKVDIVRISTFSLCPRCSLWLSVLYAKTNRLTEPGMTSRRIRPGA